ncbi:MAG: HAD family hydrolase [Chloroherpetonaceae bacterium]|nr:HAD family hydrolase [Chloroherpetonaceae bacterium]MDW8437541.1 HAD family hydrolase [Chloroherpetonaceae bacterium]
MPRLKAIFFDLGGTLLHLSYPFFQREFERLNLALDEERFFVAVSMANAAISELMSRQSGTTDATRLPLLFNRLLESLHFPFDRERFVQEVILKEHRRANLWRYCLPNTDKLLASLREHYRLAVISNADGRAEALIAEAGLLPFFEFVVDSAIVGVEKPDPKIFEIAARKMGVSPEESLYVGDVYAIDVVGACSAKMHSALLDKSGFYSDKTPTISSLFDLPEFLGKIT